MMAHQVDLKRVKKLKSESGATILKAGWSSGRLTGINPPQATSL